MEQITLSEITKGGSWNWLGSASGFFVYLMSQFIFVLEEPHPLLPLQAISLKVFAEYLLLKFLVSNWSVMMINSLYGSAIVCYCALTSGRKRFAKKALQV